jgi:hypothetical protein
MARKHVEDSLDAPGKIGLPEPHLIGRNQVCRHIPEGCPCGEALTADIPEGRRFLEIQTPDEHSLRTLNHHPGAQGLLQILGLLAQDPKLSGAEQGGSDGGPERCDIRRPHEIREDSGLLGPSDKARRRVADEQDQRNGSIPREDRSGDLDPVLGRKVLTDEDEVGLRPPDELHSRVTISDDRQNLMTETLDLRGKTRRHEALFLSNEDPQCLHVLLLLISMTECWFSRQILDGAGDRDQSGGRLKEGGKCLRRTQGPLVPARQTAWSPLIRLTLSGNGSPESHR